MHISFLDALGSHSVSVNMLKFEVWIVKAKIRMIFTLKCSFFLSEWVVIGTCIYILRISVDQQTPPKTAIICSQFC